MLMDFILSRVALMERIDNSQLKCAFSFDILLPNFNYGVKHSEIYYMRSAKWEKVDAVIYIEYSWSKN